MKILVTGGAGYIGSHTVVELVSAGYEPVIVDNFCNSHHAVLDGLREILGRDVVCHEGDCCDRDFMRRVFDDEKEIAGAIHFAALKAVGESVEKPELYRKNNIGSLETLMQVMQEYHAQLLVLSSSACVYGDPDMLPVTEETPLKKAESPYGETKQECERLIKQAVNNGRFFQAVSLRYFNPIGAHPSAKIGELPIGIPNNLVPFVTQTAAGILPELTVFGDDYDTPDGTPIRDYVHVVDLARAHIKALQYLQEKDYQKDQGSRMKDEKSKDKGSRIKDQGNSKTENLGESDSFESFSTSSIINHPSSLIDASSIINHPSSFYDVFNIGTGHGNSVLEVIKTFEEVAGNQLNYKIGPRRSGDVESLYANCDKAARELGWKAELTLADALKDAWAWQECLKDKG